MRSAPLPVGNAGKTCPVIDPKYRLLKAERLRGKTNQDIASSIVGYIRQAVLSEALIPFG